MNTNRIKMLGLALPLLAVAVAGIVFAFGNSSQTTEAATDGAVMSLRVDSSQTFDCAGGAVPGKVDVRAGEGGAPKRADDRDLVRGVVDGGEAVDQVPYLLGAID